MPYILKAGTWIQPVSVEQDNYMINDDVLLITQSERANYKRIKEAERYNASVRQQSWEHGGFTFINSLVDLSANDPATIGRLAFLSTYLDFDTQRLQKGHGNPIKKSDLSSILQISKPTAVAFYNDAVFSGLLSDHGSEGLYISKTFFRGSADKKGKQTRLYINTVRDLYHRLKSNQHHRFGYVVQLIPFINKEWNILCENPYESESQAILPLSMKGLCGKLRLSENHATRFKNAITSPIFSFGGEEQQLCAIVPTVTNYGRQNTVYVNPHLIYGGSDFIKVEGLSVAFKARVKG